MKFYEVVNQVIALLQREGRVSYRALKREFEVDDDFLEDLKEELIAVKELAVDKDGKVLVWVGATPVSSAESRVPSFTQSPTPNPQSLAERRQLTVMFCDLVGSTALSARLDPEDYRTVVQAYHTTGAAIIEKYEGHLAQHLGDGLLVYFGYPAAHEDDARRAVRTGVEIISALQRLSPSPFQGEGRGEGSVEAQSDSPHPSPLPKGAREFSGTLPRGERGLQVRIGIHTGLVVVGEIGGGERREILALGETPNLAARIQGLAAPNTVMVSAATQRLIEGYFESQPFGSHLVKGLDTPIAVYHVQSERQSAALFTGKTTLTPLVGREQEVGLLIDRWEQVKEGRGQVVLLSGEPGIGKSRLAYTLREHVTHEGSLLFEARCSPYHQHSALYPQIEVLQRTLLFTRQDTDPGKVEKLERALALYDMQESLPLFTVLLSLPTPAQYPPLNLTPQKQKERTLQALLQLLVAQAERQATVSVWEDLHWADPSSLEFLSLLIEQIPTTRLLLVLTFRPAFTPPWKLHSHITQIMLNRLGQKQVEAMIEKVAEGKGLPTEVIEQIRAKTDGVPLFVEELTKTVLESVGSIGSIESQGSRVLQTIPIPATLQEALLARLDRLSTARQIAQLGATLGREFSYELLHAVTSVNETDLQTALAKLVEAEILYQRGVGQQTRYFFKHALIQDTAYQSLLKSTRQQSHQQIAQVLANRFPETVKTQPELVAHHYTEARFTEKAIPYWQRAGERAARRSAFVEAISHLTKGIELLKTLPETSERTQQELSLQITLGMPLMATKGFGSPDLEKAYTRAVELSRQVEQTPTLFPLLSGLWIFSLARMQYKTMRELAEQMLRQAQDVQPSAGEAHYAMGVTFFLLGDFLPAREHLEQAVARDGLQAHSAPEDRRGVTRLSIVAHVLWCLGYPEQALQQSQTALIAARRQLYFWELAQVLCEGEIQLHLYLREWRVAQERAEEAIALCSEQGFSYFLALATVLRGRALAEQGEVGEGIAQMRRGMSAIRTMQVEAARPLCLYNLAAVYEKMGQAKEGLTVLEEALAIVSRTGHRRKEAELYRLKGELTLAQSSVQSLASGVQTKQKAKSKGQKAKITNPQSPTPNPQAEAEACFHKAIEIARKQQAKSWELRATTSLARLWQSQGKHQAARNTLAEIYNWFTEGFDTKDLQEAKTLLASLSS